jgi:phospholipase/carboxylesterase
MMPAERLLPSIEYETATHPSHSVIWLHGLGADGHDFVPVISELLWPNAPALRFIFPHAPFRPISINHGMQMRAWYDIFGIAPHHPEDEEGIRAAIEAITALIARAHTRGIARNRVVLGGFSQGGALALAAGLRYAQPLASIVALSSYLPLAKSLAAERSIANQHLPIFWGHGNTDPVVLYQHGQQSRQWLEQLGYTIHWHSYPMEHKVCPAELMDLRHWFAAHLGKQDA